MGEDDMSTAAHPCKAQTIFEEIGIEAIEEISCIQWMPSEMCRMMKNNAASEVKSGRRKNIKCKSMAHPVVQN